MEISEKIIELMNEKGITTYRLAKDTGISYTGLTRILNGETKNPQIDSLTLIAEYFGVKVDDLTGIEEREFPEWATSKDKRDLKKFIESPEGLYFDGIEFNEADRDKLIGMMEAMFWEARRKNKEDYKKSREKKKDK